VPKIKTVKPDTFEPNSHGIENKKPEYFFIEIPEFSDWQLRN
jgi:hypothetical protein